MSNSVSSVALMADEDRVLGNVMRRLIEEVPCELDGERFTIAGVTFRVSRREAVMLSFVLADG